jgi:hypothetical protein
MLPNVVQYVFPVRKPLDAGRLIRVLKSICGPRELRLAIGLSQSEMGHALYSVHPSPKFQQPVKQATISMWESGRGGKWRMTVKTQAAYRHVLQEIVQRDTRQPITIRIKGRRHWTVQAMRPCATCGREFTLEHSRQNKCKRCQGRSRRR